MSRARKPRRPKANMGPRFSAAGFYTEGRYFGTGANALECACAFAAALVLEYGRSVAVDACILPGAARRAFLYVAEESAEALCARRDRYGLVIVAS